MKKNCLKLVTLALAAFLIVGCTSAKKTPLTITNISTTKADMTEYHLDETNHTYFELPFESLESLLANNGNGIIYLGSPGCPFCLEAVPLLNDVVKDYSTFAYTLSFSDDAQITKFQDEIFTDFLSDDERINGLQIPQVFIVKDGKIVSNHLGTVSSHNAHERLMNSSEKKELTKIYSKMIESLN